MPGNASDGGDGFPVKYPQSTCGSPIFSTGKMQAGGQLGTKGNTNFLRIFVTPTLTLGMGSAICM